MDESGDQADEQQASEKPIGIEEQRTIERQEAEAVDEREEGVLGKRPLVEKDGDVGGEDRQGDDRRAAAGDLVADREHGPAARRR